MRLCRFTKLSMWHPIILMMVYDGVLLHSSQVLKRYLTPFSGFL